MQAVQKIQNINLQNFTNFSTNDYNVLNKKIRTSYDNSKYRDIFFKDNKEIKKYLNKKYWVVIQLEELDNNLLPLFDVIITQISSDSTKDIYQINKSNNMTLGELALLCDENNLRYGFSFVKKGNYIIINKQSDECYDSNNEDIKRYKNINELEKSVVFNGV